MASPPNKKIKLEHPEPSTGADDAAAPVSASNKGNTTEAENEGPSPQVATSQVPVPVDLLPEAQQYKISYILSGHKKAISSVKFSPDGKYLATAGFTPFLAQLKWSRRQTDKTLEFTDRRVHTEFSRPYKGNKRCRMVLLK